MTENELEFWQRLKAAVPEYEVSPQIAMGALLQVALPKRHPLYFSVWDRFSRQIVDYVVLSSKGEVLLLIELDDKTHSKERDNARDARTRQAGYATLRIESRRKPYVADLRNLILKEISL
jgi:hypothetical protein